MAKKTVKEFIREHKKDIALVVGTAIVVGGGVALYMLKGKPGELNRLLKSYDGEHDTWFTDDIKKYANACTYAYTSSPNIPIKLVELDRVIDSIRAVADEEGKLDAAVNGVVVFIDER